MSSINIALSLLSGAFRMLPDFRGQGRLYRALNDYMVFRLGAQPLVLAPMRDGTVMRVDLRSTTEASAYYRGAYDEKVMGVLKDLFDVDSGFVDVGANIGFYAIALAKRISERKGVGKVVAFEPLMSNCTRVAENVEANGLNEICVLSCAGLSDQTRDAIITLREDFVRGSGTGNAAVPVDPEFDRGFATAPIKLWRFDEVWPKLGGGISRIDVIKLDIEGHEDLCLRGGVETIGRHRPLILMELNKPYYRARRVGLDETFMPLLPDGYIVFRNMKSVWRRVRSLEECEELDNVFLVPEERMKSASYNATFRL